MQHSDCHMMACSSMSIYLVVSIAFLAENGSAYVYSVERHLKSLWLPNFLQTMQKPRVLL